MLPGGWGPRRRNPARGVSAEGSDFGPSADRERRGADPKRQGKGAVGDRRCISHPVKEHDFFWMLICVCAKTSPDKKAKFRDLKGQLHCVNHSYWLESNPSKSCGRDPLQCLKPNESQQISTTSTIIPQHVQNTKWLGPILPPPGWCWAEWVQPGGAANHRENILWTPNGPQTRPLNAPPEDPAAPLEKKNLTWNNGIKNLAPRG